MFTVSPRARLALAAALITGFATGYFSDATSTSAETEPRPAVVAPPPVLNLAPPVQQQAAAPGQVDQARAGGFLETFDGSPGAPQRWRPADWDITLSDSGRAGNRRTAMDPMQAGHGPDCGAPGEHNEIGHGPISDWGDAVFLCRDHVMTAVSTGGYGAAWLTPPAMLDFSQGEAVLRWDMSTFRSSSRDWIEVLLVPWDDDLQTVNDGHSPNHPRNGIQLLMANPAIRTDFQVFLVRDGQVQQVGGGYGLDYQSRLAMSASRRDTFELRLSRTHLKFGMPAYNLWWADNDIAPLPWGQGLVHFGHYSYTPTKDLAGNCPDAACVPNTWHWDNVSLNPAAPFALVRADQEFVDGAAPAALTFPAPAPAGGAWLRFIGYGKALELSLDGGTTWVAPQVKPDSAAPTDSTDTGTAYWHPVPAGTQRVLVRRGTSTTSWMVRDATLWSKDAPPAMTADDGRPNPSA